MSDETIKPYGVAFIRVSNGNHRENMMSVFDKENDKYYILCKDGLREQDKSSTGISGDPVVFHQSVIEDMHCDGKPKPAPRPTDTSAKQDHLDDMREIAKGLVTAMNKEGKAI